MLLLCFLLLSIAVRHGSSLVNYVPSGPTFQFVTYLTKDYRGNIRQPQYVLRTPGSGPKAPFVGFLSASGPQSRIPQFTLDTQTGYIFQRATADESASYPNGWVIMGMQYGTPASATHVDFFGWDESTVGENVPIGSGDGTEGARLNVRSAPLVCTAPSVADGDWNPQFSSYSMNCSVPEASPALNTIGSCWNSNNRFYSYDPLRWDAVRNCSPPGSQQNDPPWIIGRWAAINITYPPVVPPSSSSSSSSPASPSTQTLLSLTRLPSSSAPLLPPSSSSLQSFAPPASSLSPDPGPTTATLVPGGASPGSPTSANLASILAPTPAGTGSCSVTMLLYTTRNTVYVTAGNTAAGGGPGGAGGGASASIDVITASSVVNGTTYGCAPSIVSMGYV